MILLSFMVNWQWWFCVNFFQKWTHQEWSTCLMSSSDGQAFPEFLLLPKLIPTRVVSSTLMTTLFIEPTRVTNSLNLAACTDNSSGSKIFSNSNFCNYGTVTTRIRVGCRPFTGTRTMNSDFLVWMPTNEQHPSTEVINHTIHML